MCLVYWSLSGSNSRVVLGALTTGRCGGELAPLALSCPFPTIPAFRAGTLTAQAGLHIGDLVQPAVSR